MKKILTEEKEKHEMELATEKEKHENELAQAKSFLEGFEIHLESLNQYWTDHRKPQKPTSPAAGAEQARVTA